MKLMRIPNLIIAVLLAVVLPLEQAHCLWMGFEKHAAPDAAATASGHACCTPDTSAPQRQASQPQDVFAGCVCVQLPSAVLPVLVNATPADSPVTFLAVPTLATLGAPVSINTETVLAPDVGRLSLPDDPGAHGLRAPPLFA